MLSRGFSVGAVELGRGFSLWAVVLSRGFSVWAVVQSGRLVNLNTEYGVCES